MRKFELKILIVVLVIFLILFIFIPQEKEETIFNESNNLSNLSNSIENNVSMGQIIYSDGSEVVVELSGHDEFVKDKLVKGSMGNLMS
jgi:general stress protein 26